MISISNRFFITAALLLVFFSANAQYYYYKDIISNKELTAEMALFKENKIRTVKVNSFDREDEPSIGFFCEKKINKSYTEVETVMRSYASAESVLTTTFNKKGLVERTTDSSEIVVNTTEYSYDEKDRLIGISSTSTSKDDDLTSHSGEQHLYFYNDNNIPVKLIRIKNGRDSAIFDLIADEKGNIVEEKDQKAGKSYYYYYDSKNKLSLLMEEKMKVPEN